MALSRYATVLALSVFGATAFAQNQIAPEGELLVKMRSNSISPILRMALGATVEPAIPQLGVVKLKFSKRNNRQAMQMLRQDSGVVYSEPNYRRYWSFTPNDPRLGEQYGIPQVNAPQAWDIFKGNSNMIIGVLDSGLNITHEDIVDRIFLTRNTELDNNDMSDPVGHGTHCMGIAAGTSNNGKGIASVAFNPKLIGVKLGNSPGADASAKGLVFAADNGAKIISMSYGRGVKSQVEADAAAYAWGKGALLLVAAGNDDSNSDADIGYPALLPNVVIVGATDASGGKASFSNFGPRVQIAAPGDEILSMGTSSNSDYVKMSGTSMACPFAASVAGLVWGRNPSLKNTDVRDILFSTARPLPWVTKGLIDANAAVAKAKPLPNFVADPITTKVSTAGGLNQGTQTTGFGTPEEAANATKLNDTAYYGIRSRMLNKVGMVAGVETSIQLSQPLTSIQTARIELSATAPSPATAMVFAFSNTAGAYQMIGQFPNRGVEQNLEFSLNPLTMGQYFNAANEIRLLIRWVAPQRVNQAPYEVKINRLTLGGTYDPDLAP